MTFVKIKLGNHVFDKQNKFEGIVTHIDHESSIADVENSHFEIIESRLHDLVVVEEDAKNSENTLQIKIKYFNKDMTKLSKIAQGDWIDLRAADTVELKAGEFKLVPLGVAMELPEGYEAHVAPRGSTFKNYGVIETNSVGVVDESYKGDNDQWFMPVLAMRDTVIPFDERICQFRIVEKMPEVEFVEVEAMNNEDRGSHGSTGVK